MNRTGAWKYQAAKDSDPLLNSWLQLRSPFSMQTANGSVFSQNPPESPYFSFLLKQEVLVVKTKLSVFGRTGSRASTAQESPPPTANTHVRSVKHKGIWWRIAPGHGTTDPQLNKTDSQSPRCSISLSHRPGRSIKLTQGWGGNDKRGEPLTLSVGAVLEGGHHLSYCPKRPYINVWHHA